MDREKGGGAKSCGDKEGPRRKGKAKMADLNQRGFNQPQVVVIS